MEATRICKKCANDIACMKDEYDELHEPTKQSLMEALEYLDKPYLDTIFDASVIEAGNKNRFNPKSNMWVAYIKSIGMPQYEALRWRNSDNFKKTYRAMDLGKPQDIAKMLPSNGDAKTDEALLNYEINRKDCIRLIGYDPFANYPREDEKPILYANLISFIDEEVESTRDYITFASILTLCL